MTIAIILVHNKSDKENEAQVSFLKPLINKVIDTFPVFDEEGKQTGTQEGYHYELDGLELPHELKVFQVFPFGVTVANKDEIDSHKVFYGVGDEDKVGDHPRFFNWGLKRGTDYGADVVIHLEDYKKLDLDDLAIQLNTLIDPEDKHELIDDVAVKISTLKLLKEVGQLKEEKPLTEAFNDLKQRVTEKGLNHG